MQAFFLIVSTFNTSFLSLESGTNYNTMNEALNAASQMGDINLLYTLIQVDPYLMEHIAPIPFVDTPLHVAAASGQSSFATEIIRMKPLFAWKLNQHGLSPMHLALQNGHYRTACRLVDINRDLVRVKGREGLTPLHFVTQIGKTDLIARFLSACPGSVKDVTVRSETALHIAAKHKQVEALEVLVGWIQRNCQKRSEGVEKGVLNWEDEEGNTVLHIAVLKRLPQAVRLLIDSNIDLNAKNLVGLTALDMVEINQTLDHSAEIRDMLTSAGALYGFSLAAAPLQEDELRSKITFHKRVAISTTRLRRRISNDTRNALLVVAILFATSTYEAALSPPGGVYQAEGSALVPPAPVNRIGSPLRSSPNPAAQKSAGKVVMEVEAFIWFWLFNTCAFYLSILMICLLMPRGRISVIVSSPLTLFSGCYVLSMLVISPSLNIAIATVVMPCMLLALYCWWASVYIKLAKKLRKYALKQDDGSRFSGGNKW